MNAVRSLEWVVWVIVMAVALLLLFATATASGGGDVDAGWPVPPGVAVEQLAPGAVFA